MNPASHGYLVAVLTRQELPAPDADATDLVDFAARYDAYERWADSPESLAMLLEPIHREWDRHGVLPAWAGVDSLRALLFFEYRADRFAGGSEDGSMRMRAIVEELRSRLESH